MNNQLVTIGLAIVAFLVALWLVIVIVRMLLGGKLRMPGGRTRQPRLGIVDAFDLDRQRQLIIVRRDNTEHLIMIGGPNDLVIESEIVRVEARDFRDSRRDKGAEFGGAPASDSRIPAPFAPAGERVAEEMPPAVEEPLLPMRLPEVQPVPAPLEPRFESAPRAEASAPPPAPPAAQRTPPTFPLPPRRPVVSPPERRPVQTPRLPDAPSRTEPTAPSMELAPQRMEQEAAPTVSTAAAPRPTVAPPMTSPPIVAPPMTPPPVMAPPAAPMEPPATAPILEVPSDVVRPAPRPTPPSFLKPLPPRPPIRPFKRPMPQPAPAPDAATTPASSEPVRDATISAAPPPPSQPVPPQPVPAAPVQSAAQPAPVAPPPAPAAAQPDALESLEEEMAKLLGRG